MPLYSYTVFLCAPPERFWRLPISISAIEEGFTQHIEPEKVDRLAQFYGVPVTDFLDEFNHFLYDGQAVRIRAYRESFGMGKKPFARKMGIPVRCLQEWESGRKVISIKCWERHFKGRA